MANPLVMAWIGLALVASNDSVEAVFFADENSQDYFANRIPEIPSGRVMEEGYRIKDRPWWHEAVKEDRLYLASPTVDLVTKEVLVAIQTTVYLEDGTLLGVGGMDVELDTVGNLLQQVQYRYRYPMLNTTINTSLIMRVRSI